MSSVFLSHSHTDKSFARQLARDLRAIGAKVWIDEAEIQVGDSLIEKIREGIDRMEYVAALLSPRSVASRWVRQELDVAMNQQIQGKQIKVLPLLIEECELPGFLVGKLYLDFTKAKNYVENFAKLAKRLGLESAYTPADMSNLWQMFSIAQKQGDVDLFKKALPGLIRALDGSNREDARDLLGGSHEWPESFRDFTVEYLLASVQEDHRIGLSALNILRELGQKSDSVPKHIAHALTSGHRAERLAAHLFLIQKDPLTNISEAKETLESSQSPQHLRIASVWILGSSHDVSAFTCLSQVASNIRREECTLQYALVDSLVQGGGSSALEGLRHVFTQVEDPWIRYQAAKRFVELVPQLFRWAQEPYLNTLPEARRIVAEWEGRTVESSSV